MEKNIEALNEKGLPYITLNPNSLEEIAADINKVGEALGDKKLGVERADRFRSEIEAFRTKNIVNDNQPALYWEWWPKPVFTPGSSNWLTV